MNRLQGRRFVVITLFDDEASVVQALEAGASGYVSKQADRPTVSPPPPRSFPAT